MAVLEFSSRRWLVVLFLTLGFTAQLPAQHVFCAEHEGKIYIVDKMHSDRVSIQKDGKTMEVSAKRCALTPVEEYRPAFIAVQDMEVKTTWVSADINTVVHFRAKFETPFVLPDVFVPSGKAPASAGAGKTHAQILYPNAA